MAKKKVTFSRYDAADHLKTEVDIAAYLKACKEDGGDDPAVMEVARADIERARERIASAAQLQKACAALASAYQAVGSLAASTGTFTTPQVESLLDLLSSWEEMTLEEIEAFLPWPKEPLPANRADELERRVFELEQLLRKTRSAKK